MMALPKRKHSNSRTRKRRTHDKVTALPMVKCGNCEAWVRPHNACGKCGYYKGRKVDYTTKPEDKKKARSGRA